MSKVKAFLKRKDIVFSAKRYFIDAMSAMAQGLSLPEGCIRWQALEEEATP